MKKAVVVMVAALVASLAVGRGRRLRGHSGKEWQQRQRRHKFPRVIQAEGSIHDLCPLYGRSGSQKARTIHQVVYNVTNSSMKR